MPKLRDRVEAAERAVIALGRLEFEWDEDAHPRDDRGRFGSGGGGDEEKLSQLRESARISKEDKNAFQRESKIQDFRQTNPAYGAYSAHIEARLADEFKAGRDSATLNKGPDGNYTPERLAQQAELMDRFIKGDLRDMNGQPLALTPWDRVPSNREGMVLAGLGASGKTTLLNGLNDPEAYSFVKTSGMDREGVGDLKVDLAQCVTINHDDIKEAMIDGGMAAKYEGLTAGESAPLLHEESVDIAKALAREAIDQGKAVVFDWGAPAARSDMAEQIALMHANGYQVRGVLVDGSVARSVAGAAIRHLGPDSGPGKEAADSKRYVQFEHMEAQAYKGTETGPTGERLKSDTAATFKENQNLFDQSWWFDRSDTSNTYDLVSST